MREEEIEVGDIVMVHSMGVKGTVSTEPNSKGKCFVQMGILRSLINIRDLELIDIPEITTPALSKTGSGKIKMSKSLNVSPELNIIGKTVDEGIAILDKY